LGTKAKVIRQPACRTSDTSLKKSAQGAYFDFTVVSNYLECIVLVGVLIVLGIAAALLESL
jgi:hypothetical protein